MIPILNCQTILKFLGGNATETVKHAFQNRTIRYACIKLLQPQQFPGILTPRPLLGQLLSQVFCSTCCHNHNSADFLQESAPPSTTMSQSSTTF
jgi:hypothetical protein